MLDTQFANYEYKDKCTILTSMDYNTDSAKLPRISIGHDAYIRKGREFTTDFCCICKLRSWLQQVIFALLLAGGENSFFTMESLVLFRMTLVTNNRCSSMQNLSHYSGDTLTHSVTTSSFMLLISTHQLKQSKIES